MATRRVFVLLAAATICVAHPAFAAQEPADAIAAIYQAYIKAERNKGMAPDQLALKYYSARRQAQIIALKKACKGKDPCLPDADFFIDGQNYKIRDLDVRTRSKNAQKAEVEARFRNFDTAQRVVFSLVNEGKGWRIDDMEGGIEGARYTLDTMLKPVTEE